MAEISRPMINDALRLLRLYLGFSQQQVASKTDLSQSMISDIEKGRKSVSMEVLDRYSSSLNVKMSDLLFFAEEIDGHPVATRGKLIVAPRLLAILERLAPAEISDAP